jgi:hypothetical protein
MTKPLLLLDIDGPLNPWDANPNRRPEGYTTHRFDPVDQYGQKWTSVIRYPRRKPLRVWLKPDHGPQLLALADRFDLVWASTWGAEANGLIGPAIGLPELPYVDFWAETKTPDKRERVNGVYWKVPLLLAYAAGRPFAWVDDEVTNADREYTTEHHESATLLYYVSPRLGLLEQDFETLAHWAKSL